MKAAIKFIQFSHLRNEAHYEFLLVVLNLLDNFPAVKALIAARYDTYSDLLSLEKTLLDAAHASALTQRLADADHRVDRDVAGIKAAVNAALYHLDPNMAEAARELHLRLKEFGNIRSKSYEEESAAIQVLLRDFAGAYAAQAERVGIMLWVRDLAAAEAEFTQLYSQRNTEVADRPQQRFKDMRKEIEAVYHQISTLVAAAATMDTTGAYDEFIRQLNAEIDYFNEHNHHHAKKDLATGNATSVAPIPTQPYTGKPIAVIPQAYYTEAGKPAKELVFATDFTVTYKNNTEAGTADLIIHGKGGYKGQKVVTFNIARA
jgi:hypothetical protein